MKSYGQLWQRIVSEENLREAWRLFRRRHANQRPVQRFGAKLDDNLRIVRSRLAKGTWRPSPYHQFRVFEPKPRVISCVPVKDRIVHHSLCNVVAPLMERRFIDQSYACRKNRGSHMACRRARELCGQFPYYLKMDIRHYFESVDHDILLGLVNKLCREREVQNLVRLIVEKPIPNFAKQPGKGLPIGNLTSQWFANFYLDGFDHFMMDGIGLGRRYLRYMDDMLVFCRSKAEAWAIRNESAEWLGRNRSLELKDEATVVAPVTEGVPFLGLRIWAGHWRMRHNRWRRTQRSARKHFRAHARALDDFLKGRIGTGDMVAADEKLRNTIRAMDGSVRWFGFRGVYDRQTRENRKAVSGADMTSGSFHASVATRGGNYNNDGTNCRSSYRGGNNATNNASTYANANNGFRLSSNCASGIGATSDAKTKRYAETPEQEETCTNPIPNTRCHASSVDEQAIYGTEQVGADTPNASSLAAKEVVGRVGFRQSQSSRPALYFTKSNKRKEVQHEKS